MLHNRSIPKVVNFSFSYAAKVSCDELGIFDVVVVTCDHWQHVKLRQRHRVETRTKDQWIPDTQDEVKTFLIYGSRYHLCGRTNLGTLHLTSGTRVLRAAPAQRFVLVIRS